MKTLKHSILKKLLTNFQVLGYAMDWSFFWLQLRIFTNHLVSFYTSTDTFFLPCEDSAVLFPSSSLTNVLRHPLIIRGAAPSQNRFARSTAFNHIQYVKCVKSTMKDLDKEIYLVDDNWMPCFQNSNLRHCEVENTKLQNSS